MAYSQDFRDTVLAVKGKNHLTIAHTAARFCIGIATVKRWMKDPWLKTTKDRPSMKINLQALQKDIQNHPDDYQYERAVRFCCSPSGIGAALKKLRISYKKTLIHPKRNEQQRQLFRTRIAQHRSLGRVIIPLDESGFSHSMPRTHGYAPIGQRCYGKHDWGAKGRTNVIAAMLEHVLIAVTLFTCNINADIFYTWLQEALLPIIPSGSVLVMDNAAFHKRNDIQQLIRRSGL